VRIEPFHEKYTSTIKTVAPSATPTGIKNARFTEGGHSLERRDTHQPEGAPLAVPGNNPMRANVSSPELLTLEYRGLFAGGARRRTLRTIGNAAFVP
jgi:hypothetical protein